MIDYNAIVQNLPPDLRETMLQLTNAVEQNLREQLVPHQDTIVGVQAFVNGLAESQQTSIERLDRTEAILVQRSTTEPRVEIHLEQLTQVQESAEASLERLTEVVLTQERITERMDQLVDEVVEVSQALTHVRMCLLQANEWRLEQRMIERAPLYFNHWLRRINVLWPGQLQPTLEEQLDDHLTTDEKDEILRLDAVLHGQTLFTTEPEEVYVALEVAITIDQHDVSCVYERAALLRRLGLRVIPVVAGEMADSVTEAEAQSNNVVILYNDNTQEWEQALAVI